MAFGSAEDEDTLTEINVTPLVDVCLVLVIVFMVTAPFFAKPLMELTLPRAITGEGEGRENITISISPKFGFAINDENIGSSNDLLPELAKKIKDTGYTFVVIRADEQVPHGTVLEVMDMARLAGATRVAFATEQREDY